MMHDLISYDGVTFTCPICSRQYIWDGKTVTLTREGSQPDARHRGGWGMAISEIDFAVVNMPARPELFSRN